MLKVLEQAKICSASDFCKLDIVDWGRLNGYFKNDIASLIYALDKYLAHNAVYTLIEDDLTRYPERSDWPNWRHVGRDHERLGRLYWNMFQQCFENEGTLHFADAPDFHGTLLHSDGRVGTFYGDIGKISASAFFH